MGVEIRPFTRRRSDFLRRRSDLFPTSLRARRSRSQIRHGPKVRIEGHPVLVSDGVISAEEAKRGGGANQVWLPAGELYLAPVPEKAQERVTLLSPKPAGPVTAAGGKPRGRSNGSDLVGAAGIEPATLCSQSRYATSALRPERGDYPTAGRQMPFRRRPNVNA